MESNHLNIAPGQALPIGCKWLTNGFNFSLISKEATSVTLVLYDLEQGQILKEIPLNPEIHKTGNVWHVFVEAESSLGYMYKIVGPPPYFNPTLKLLDPYAKAIFSPITWGTSKDYNPLALALPDKPFNWENDYPPKIPEKDLIIYEMHTRGFTKDNSSHAQFPGTFSAVIEKIPHLLELGINAVEFLPLQEFNECEYQLYHPQVKEHLFQYWGYSTVNFFTPMNRYASSEEPGAAIQEFKQMVKALHQNGIEVILDMVFNHTSEGDEKGPITCYKGIDRNVYYLTENEGRLMNFTGCGNTFNTNHPTSIQLIIDALRYWVLEMHVDGFRFDLASIFYRNMQGEVIFSPPVLEAISQDPILAQVKLIAEPWDAAGLYQVGGFYPDQLRWSEWNARYRDTVRRFIKGTPNQKGRFASRLSGSQDLYDTRSPLSSINFIIAHDGFTLRDLVSYNQKHNMGNGENNRDGANNNESWNCGMEGPTEESEILELRDRQMRNFHLALMISQGIPMLHMGDEYGHTKLGNNNTWCQDNSLNWFLWDKLQENEGFFCYYKKLIALRKKHEVFRQGRFLTEKDIQWCGSQGEKIQWDHETQFLAFTMSEFYCAFNAQQHPQKVILPDGAWRIVVNTSNPSPNDVYDEGSEPIVNNGHIEMLPYSSILLKQ